jgi:hypothetical protein
MAAHAERDEDVGRARKSPADVRASVVGLVAGFVRWVGLLLALTLVIHILLTVGQANPDNGITVFFADAAKPLSLGFHNLFTPANTELRVLVNEGLAALFWLIVSGVLTRLIRRLG